MWCPEQVDVHDQPSQVMSCWVTDTPNPMTGRRIPLRFRFHVAMAGVLGIGGNLTEWGDAECAEAAELVAQYKKVRQLVQHGRQYRLGVPGEDVHGVQYVAADGGEAVVLAYRETGRFRDDAPPLRLRGLQAEAEYRIDGAGVRSGAALTHTACRRTCPETSPARCCTSSGCRDLQFPIHVTGFGHDPGIVRSGLGEAENIAQHGSTSMLRYGRSCGKPPRLRQIAVPALR